MGAYGGLNIASDQATQDVLGGAAGNDLASTESYNLGENAVVPDTSNIDLPGQFPGIPGGAISNGGIAATDSSGVNALYLHPGVNPTPTGGYMAAAAAVVAAAAQGFTTYAKGSPQVAIPGARTPLGTTRGGAFALVSATGQTNWLLIGGIVVVSVVILTWLAKKA